MSLETTDIFLLKNRFHIVAVWGRLDNGKGPENYLDKTTEGEMLRKRLIEMKVD